MALGALIATGQAPLGWWGLALVALSGLTFVIARERSVARAVWLGWLAGAGQFGAAMFWIVDPFMVDPGRDGWMAPFALLFMAFGMALFWALAAGIGAALGRGLPSRALGFALGLAATDLLRTYVFTGFPWALVGHIWVGTWPAQADIFLGPVGLSLMTTLAAALPFAVPRGRGILLSALLLGMAGGFGLWRLDQPVPPRPQPITVRLVQPDAEQALKWRPDMQRVFFDRQLRYTAAPGKDGRRPDLIVWPETSAPFLLNNPGIGLQMIAAAAQGVPVALGIQRVSGRRAYNSLAVLDTRGDVEDVYDKHHLVPFGEYMPLGDFLGKYFGITAFAAQQGNGYSPGPGAAVLALGRLGHVLPLICYEAVFPQDIRAAPSRPDWMLQVTNDGWFGNLAGPYQHLAQARLRAIEEGVPLLRAANTGVSGVIDAKGRLLKTLPLNSKGYLDVTVPGSLPAPPYARWGDGPVLGLLLAGLAAVAIGARRRGGPAA
ncbi:apolipoprotein N-acyltransferase [Acidimangrovimonas pyrenivorans]|uniref:Apolipoprotein N-acyltransferase n=1 Tax=Acidimangrovimonas pyrenivorans TaxID=2030798 RepID=A0ABV7AIR4_9RHOB